MKYYSNKSAYKLAFVCSIGWMLFLSCTKVKDFSSGYDIKWPVPKITAITPVKDTIGKTMTITGESFDKVTKVSIGVPETQAEIITASANSIQVKIPRTVSAGPVTVYTNYKQTGVSAESFTPIFLDVNITGWPTRITRGQAFVIKGTNMDMVLEVDVNGNKIAVSPTASSSPDQLSVTTLGFVLPDQITVKITKAKAGIVNGTSSIIKVENPSNFFIAVDPVVIFDFETGANPFVAGNSGAISGFNTSGAAKARDARYLSVQKTGAVAWQGLGDINYSTPVSLSTFHKPYFTFLVNTRGKDGYMQAEFIQNGTHWGMHFKAANSSFDYNLNTTGWTWVSVELKTDNLEKWSGSGTSFDPLGTIDAIALGFKRGNGTSSDYEINIDQLMITDGPQKPVVKAFDFEDGVNPYSGTATNGINQSGIATKSGNKYLTVGLTNAANWKWTGDISKAGPIDLSAVANPYINFWINTNGKKGFFQLETNQSSVKWGGDLNSSDYFVQTTGWKLYSLRLADIDWSKWGGSGTATSLDVKGILDYFKIGFSTGNVAGGYEVNIDDVYISDGPMF